MRVLILDQDMNYLQRFKYYLSKKYANIQISACDNLFSAVQMIRNDYYDVILFSVSFEEVKNEEIDVAIGNTAFAYLSDTNETIGSVKTIFKYSSVSKFYDELCELYEKKKNRTIKRDDTETKQEKKTEIITFLPIHGGAGSSTMAAACAISLAVDSNVLYVNLEQRPSDAVFFSGEKKRGITDIVSMLKTKYTDAGLCQLFSEVIQRDGRQQKAKVDFIKGYINILDSLSMTEQGMEVVMKTLREKLNYRYIIVDADFVVGAVLGKLISSSDKLMFVTSGADISNTKLSGVQRYLDILKQNENQSMPNSYLLLNQYYGKNDELTVAHDMKIIARLPRYRTGDKSRITSQDIIDQLLSGDDIFRKLKTIEASAEH